jgi:hypothetical protein
VRSWFIVKSSWLDISAFGKFFPPAFYAHLRALDPGDKGASYPYMAHIKQKRLHKVEPKNSFFKHSCSNTTKLGRQTSKTGGRSGGG